jgi:putative heme iron utilization protein
VTNEKLSETLQQEILDFIHSRKSMQLATLTLEGQPYASYAPFAIGEDCLYVLLSDVAVHAVNLKNTPQASVLILEDEDTAGELFARLRVSYSVNAEYIDSADTRWQGVIELMAARLGSRINGLSQLSDFKLFKLVPSKGRYVKGFGRAYAFTGISLTGTALDHLRDGHKKREAV